MRNHATLTTGGLNDDDWRSLPVGPQWLYVALLRQPRLTLAGQLDYMPSRWTGSAAGVEVWHVLDWLHDLRVGRFVVVDEATDELIIRSFTVHDLKPGRMSLPVIKGFWNAYCAVMSPVLRQIIIEVIPSVLWTKVSPHAPPEAHDFRRSVPFEWGQLVPLPRQPSLPLECPVTSHLSPELVATHSISPTGGTGSEPPGVHDADQQQPVRDVDQLTNRAVRLYADHRTAVAPNVTDPAAYAAAAGRGALGDGTRDRMAAMIRDGASPEQAAMAVATEGPPDPITGVRRASGGLVDQTAVEQARADAARREAETAERLAVIRGEPADPGAGLAMLREARAARREGTTP